MSDIHASKSISSAKLDLLAVYHVLGARLPISSYLASQPEALPLSPLDYLQSPLITTSVVWVYESPRQSNPRVQHPSPSFDDIANAEEEGEIIPLDRLKRALEIVLDYYPHMTGRLVYDTNTGRPSITTWKLEPNCAKCSVPPRFPLSQPRHDLTTPKTALRA